MTRKLYALFVGIDDYVTPVRPLMGCVNDVRRMRTLFEERINDERDQFLPLSLTNGEATRDNVIKAFREHLGQAGPDDTALFYFSGHGSQEQAPPAFWHLEPDRLNETLVCYDSRQTGGWDLADKELSALIAEVAQNGAQVTAILDCCHSGSGTRDALDDLRGGVRVRLQAGDKRARPLDSYFLGAEGAADIEATTLGGANWIALPQGRHVLLAACRDSELAKEIRFGDEQRGVFSYFLQDTLQNTAGALSYRTIFKRIQALVPTRVQKQMPVIEAVESADLDRPFLGGAIAGRDPVFTLSYRDRRWVIDGGAVHGIGAPSGMEKTVLAIFDGDTPLAELDSLSKAIGEAQVERVEAGESEVSISTRYGQPLDKAQVYQAVVVAQPLPPMVVAFEGDEEALQLVREALAEARPGGRPSLVVREGSLEEAAYRLRAMVRTKRGAEEQLYRISRKADAYPLVVDSAGFSRESATVAVQRLEHIARWQKLVELTNPTSGIPENAVTMTFYYEGEDGEDYEADGVEELLFAYRPPYGPRDYPRYKVKLVNRGDRPYTCTLLNLTQSYSSYAGLLPGGSVRLEPGEEAWGAIRDRQGLLQQAIPVTIPEKLYEQGVTRLRDIVKLIVSTDELDASLLAMESLPITVAEAVARKMPSGMNTLERLMERVHTRDMGIYPAADEAFSDWQTAEVSAVVTRPMARQAVAQPGEETALASGVSLAGHDLQAAAHLSSLNSVGRDMGNLIAPPLIRDNPAVFEPLEFTDGSGGEAGLAVLELEGVVGKTAVSAENPLVLSMEGKPQKGAVILPFTFDGEFYLPLGKASVVDGRTEIAIEQLPVSEVAVERAPGGGSIRIMFQKILSDQIGLDFDYPQLAAADVDDDGHVTYEDDATAVRRRMQDAGRILLYVHGLFGDSEGYVASAVAAEVEDGEPLKLADFYDLILAYDYESVNTPIEESARQLRLLLEGVGLGAGHGKTLHIVAHSMGGLVSRWFIEQEGGHEIVERLVTLGTPHRGTPWPKVHDWLTTLLVLGLNGLSSVAWPVKVAAALVKATEAIDVTVDQMAPDSTFIKLLASNRDPGIPITTFAGNTSIPPAAAVAQPDETASRLERLLDRLEDMKLLEKAAGLAFFGEPNDIAVSVKSAHGLPQGHAQGTAVEIACDHMSFFLLTDSLNRLAEELGG